MRKNFLLYGLTITILLFAALTVQADDDVTTRRNDDGTWTVVKPAGMDLKLEVIYYTKEELDSIAALNSTPSLKTEAEEKVGKKKTANVKNKRTTNSRSRHGRSRHRSRRR